jgi:carotenoid cleavage dioxygenase-like enzyme
LNPVADLFRPVPPEGSQVAATITGELPFPLEGSWIMNGPARFERNGLRYRHWLDGDGLLRSLRFDAAGMTYTWRWVHSRKWRAEEQAGRAIYRTFGTRFDGDRLNDRGLGLDSPVNVSVLPVAGHLLAFGEQGLPYAVDPLSLDTIGEHTFGRALNEVSPFSAHPSLDLVTGELVSFGISYSATRPCLSFYRFNPLGKLIRRRRVAIPHPSSVHDFALGPRHAVFYLSAHHLDMAALRDGASVMAALEWQPEHGSHLLILDRDDGHSCALINIDARYCLHVVNCFEADGELVLDLLELDEPLYPEYQTMPELFETAGPARPVRYRIDRASWSVADRQEIATGLLHDFPAIDPRRAQASTGHSWMAGISTTGKPGAKFLDRLVCVDWEQLRLSDAFQTPDGSFLGSEPLVVPHPGDPDTVAVLCRMLTPAKGQDSVLVFDGHDLAAGPVATIRLPAATPPSFHGWWMTG